MLKILKALWNRQRFVIHDNGTVTDLSTGLMWQQKTSELAMTWKEAREHCLLWITVDGNHGWRLPNVCELQSLVDYTRFFSVIDITAFPDKVSSYYWSSTPYAGDTGLAWCMDFSLGGDFLNNKSTTHYVRAVRGGGIKSKIIALLWAIRKELKWNQCKSEIN